MSLRIGIAGCGAVSRVYYAEALAALAREDRDVTVAALFDPDRAAVQQMAALFPQAAAVTDWDSFLAAAPDVAIVASPPQFHAAQAVALLEGGSAVLCEKPLAPSLAEAEAIAAAAARPGALLAVGMLRRYLPAANAIGWILSSGAFGALRRIRWLEGGRFRWPVASLDYFGPKSGGVLSDIGVHVLDLLQWWLGDLTLESYADDRAGGTETNCLIRLSDRSGAAVAVRLTRDDDPPVACRIDCERGTILWRDGHPSDFDMIPAQAASADLARVAHVAAAAKAEVWSFERAFVAQLRDLVDARRQGRPPRVSADGTLPTIALIEACARLRRPLPMPWLSPDERKGLADLAAGDRA